MCYQDQNILYFMFAVLCVYVKIHCCAVLSILSERCSLHRSLGSLAQRFEVVSAGWAVERR